MKLFQFPATVLAVCLVVVGCEDSNSGPANPDQADATGTHIHGDDGHSHDDGHDHSSHDHDPPHGGKLVELGRNHKYHAEIVNDSENGSVAVYILDDHAEPLVIDAPSIQIVLTSGEATQTFALAAETVDDSQKFAIVDPEAEAMYRADDASGKVRVTIDGKPYTGLF